MHSQIEKFDGMKAEYQAATPSRFRRTRTGLYGSGDAHVWNRFQFNQLREYARDMERNDCIIKAVLNRAVENIIQGGFRPEPMTGDPVLNKAIEDRWKDWSEDKQQCDPQGEFTFWQMEKMVLRQEMLDGDIFALPLEDGTLQLIEGDRCQSPTGMAGISYPDTGNYAVHGVVTDPLRRRVEYWFTKDAGKYHLIRYSDLSRYPAYDDEKNKLVFHVYNPHRTTLSRGITAFHPIFDVLGMFEDVNFAKLIQAQMVSMIGAFITTTAKDATTADVRLGERDTQNLVDGNGVVIEGMSPGMIPRLPYGKDLKPFNAQVPNPEYFPHVKLLLQLVGANLGIPLQVLMLDPSDSGSFSAWRGAFDQAKTGWKMAQKSIESNFHRETYASNVRRWSNEFGNAAKKLGKKLFCHKWHKPSWSYIQPQQDAQGNDVRVKSLQTSSRRVAAEQGMEFDDIVRETVEDNTAAILLAINASKAIKQQTQVDVPWREVLGWALPTGVTAADPLASGAGAAQPAQSPGKPAEDSPTKPGQPDGETQPKDTETEDDDGQ